MLTRTPTSAGNQKAIIKGNNAQFYFIEEGAIDTKLIPCELQKEFQVNNLKVTVSGEVKVIAQPGQGPCCSGYLVISRISK